MRIVDLLAFVNSLRIIGDKMGVIDSPLQAHIDLLQPEGRQERESREEGGENIRMDLLCET